MLKELPLSSCSNPTNGGFRNCVLRGKIYVGVVWKFSHDLYDLRLGQFGAANTSAAGSARSMLNLVCLIFRVRSPAQVMRVYAQLVSTTVSNLCAWKRLRPVKKGAHNNVWPGVAAINVDGAISVRGRCERPNNALRHTRACGIMNELKRFAIGRFPHLFRISVFFPSLVMSGTPKATKSGSVALPCTAYFLGIFHGIRIQNVTYSVHGGAYK